MNFLIVLTVLMLAATIVAIFKFTRSKFAAVNWLIAGSVVVLFVFPTIDAVVSGRVTGGM